MELARLLTPDSHRVREAGHSLGLLSSLGVEGIYGRRVWCFIDIWSRTRNLSISHVKYWIIITGIVTPFSLADTTPAADYR